MASETRTPNQELQTVVDTFIAQAAEPALLDDGEEPLRLIADQWSLSDWNGRLVLQAWDSRRNLVRKILAVKEQRRDRIALITERFPKSESELQLADLAAPAGRELERKTSRLAFRERLYLILAREFPGWRIEEISAEPNLEESLSPSFVRAFLRRGSVGIAAIAAPPGLIDCAGVLTFGLIWLDYLRRREKPLSISKLLVYVPLRCEQEIAFRMAWIDPDRVEIGAYVFDERDRVGSLDVTDAGNVDSMLPPCRRPDIPNARHMLFPEMPGTDSIEQSDGSISFRVFGLEFARAQPAPEGCKLTCGISRRSRATVETIVAMSRELARVRNRSSEDQQNPLYSMNPEGWLESQVRASPTSIDASLVSEPIYGQVPVFSGAERGVIDLLGIDYTGRMVVIEIKASADLHLPFQALDYWLRVRKHLTAGDFERLGYFPGRIIRREPPRILLVAPALEFHSTTETVLGFLSPRIEFTRIGLAASWRSELRVMFRLRGSQRPEAESPQISESSSPGALTIA